MRCAFALLAGSVLFAQSPMGYLGLRFGNWYYYEGVYVDTLAGDPLRDYILYDTTKITEQFTYQGHDALTMVARDSAHSAVYGDTIMAKADTAYDESPWVRLLSDITEDTTVDLYAYRTPLSVGDFWSTGLAGTYYWDIDGDFINDTIVIRKDTTYVEAQEDKTVPAGTFNCYKLYTKTRASAYVTTGADTGQVLTDRWEWWYPGLGMIADTQHMEYIGYYGAIPIPLYHQWRSHNLVSVDVEETAGAGLDQGIRVRLLGASAEITFTLPGAGKALVSIYDPAGRVVESRQIETRAGENSLMWSGKSGVYLVRISALGQDMTGRFVLR